MANKTPNFGLWTRGPLAHENGAGGAADQTDFDINMGIIDANLGGGGGGVPAGSNGQIQFNDSGAFGGDARFTWDKTDGFLRIVAGSPQREDGGMVRLDNVNGLIPLTVVAEGTTDQFYPLAARFSTYGVSQTGQNIGDAEGVRIVVEGATSSGSALDNIRGLIITTSATGLVATTNSLGLQIDDVTGATNNWAIKTGLGLVELGDALKVDGNIGFFATTPTTKKAVSGSRGSNAALASLMTALAAYGLVTDSTS